MGDVPGSGSFPAIPTQGWRPAYLGGCPQLSLRRRPGAFL